MWPPKEPTKHQPFGGVTGQPLADFKEIRSGEAIASRALVAIGGDGLIYEARAAYTNVLGVAVDAAVSGGLVQIRPVGFISGVIADGSFGVGDMLTYATTAGRVVLFSTASGLEGGGAWVADPNHTHTGPVHTHVIDPDSPDNPHDHGGVTGSQGGGNTGTPSDIVLVANNNHTHTTPIGQCVGRALTAGTAGNPVDMLVWIG